MQTTYRRSCWRQHAQRDVQMRTACKAWFLLLLVASTHPATAAYKHSSSRLLRGTHDTLQDSQSDGMSTPPRVVHSTGPCSPIPREEPYNLIYTAQSNGKCHQSEMAVTG
eukprot:363900-Chlamydomonas_euryale.AAC.3